MRLYLDLDGVMFDFDKHFVDTFTVNNKNLNDDVMWSMIESYDTFFLDLPLMEGAKEFFDAMQSLFSEKLYILTACPKRMYKRAALQKKAAVKNHLSENVTVIPMLGGRNKSLFMHNPGDILVDDFESNIESWNSLHGLGVLHKNFDDTEQQILKHLFGR